MIVTLVGVETLICHRRTIASLLYSSICAPKFDILTIYESAVYLEHTISGRDCSSGIPAFDNVFDTGSGPTPRCLLHVILVGHQKGEAS